MILVIVIATGVALGFGLEFFGPDGRKIRAQKAELKRLKMML